MTMWNNDKNTSKLSSPDPNLGPLDGGRHTTLLGWTLPRSKRQENALENTNILCTTCLCATFYI
jgi:hypothetical protein